MPRWGRFCLTAYGRVARAINTPQFDNSPATTATEDVEYTFTPALTGGKEPFTFAIIVNVPEDYTFNTSTGAFTWTPSSPGVRPGLRITCTDAIGRTVSVTWDIDVAGAANTISPGAGWGGAATAFGTPLPDESHGDSGAPEYANIVKANWIDPPFREYTTSPFNIGMVAFQSPTAAEYAAGIKNGINYVLMSVDGGDWVQVDEMTLEPERGVVCYWLTADPAEFDDGEHEARFIAVPHTGKARIGQGAVSRTAAVHSLYFWTNYNGTLATATRYISGTGSDSNDGLAPETPMRSIGAASNALRLAMPSNIVGGGRILCAEGIYTCQDGGVSSTRACGNRWLSIEAAPGVAAEDVQIGGVFDSVRYHNYNSRIELMRFKSVNVGYMILPPASGNAMKAVLFEDVRSVGPGPLYIAPTGDAYDEKDQCPAWAPLFPQGVYHVGGEYSKWPELFNDTQLVRGSLTTPVKAKALVGESSFGGDLIAGICRVVINFEVERDANWGGFGHPDFWQITTTSAGGNIIGYGLMHRGPYPGWIKSNGTWTGLAFVDVTMEGMGDPALDFRGSGVTDLFMLRWNAASTAAPLMTSGSGYTRCKIVDSHIDLLSLTPPTGWTYLGVT